MILKKFWALLIFYFSFNIDYQYTSLKLRTSFLRFQQKKIFFISNFRFRVDTKMPIRKIDVLSKIHKIFYNLCLLIYIHLKYFSKVTFWLFDVTAIYVHAWNYFLNAYESRDKWAIFF